MRVNEIFESIQGEGSQSGSFMKFVRFSGCNLKCKFCDTKHEDGWMVSPAELHEQLKKSKRLCFTGGEPLIQKDLQLLMGLFRKKTHFVKPFIQLETNGELLEKNRILMRMFDLVTVSPKGDFDRFKEIVNSVVGVTKKNEFKLIVMGKDEEKILKRVQYLIDYTDYPVYLQPVSCKPEAMRLCVKIIKEHVPKTLFWSSGRIKVGLQIQKILGIP